VSLGLTDVSTLLVTSIAAVLATASLVIFWRFFSGGGIGKVALRFLSIVLSQVLVLMAFGMQINRTNDFYSSWSDLFGTSNLYSSTATQAGSIKILDKKDLLSATPLPDKGLLVHDVIVEKDSGVSNIVYLALSKSAVSEIKRNHPLDGKKYRVVEFLTGYPSQPIMWITILQIDKVLADYNRTHPKQQIVGVFPEVNVAGHYDLECMNLPNGKPAAETWLTKDMHSFVNSRLGNLPARWGIMGVSTGGWCAAMLSVRHPDMYSAAASIAGYYRPALPLSYPVALQEKMTLKYNFELAESKLTQTIPLYLTASVKDKYSFRETSKFLALDHPHLKITYKELQEGGHNSRVWISLIPDAFDWLQRNIPM
jgi:hypothetical protein